MTEITHNNNYYSHAGQRSKGHLEEKLKTILKVRVIALTETIIFLSSVVLFDIFLGDGTRYITSTLHPFWIIILLVTAQYGPREALVAALLASAFLLIGNSSEQSLQENLYEYYFRMARLPFLWISTALVMSTIRSRQIDEKKDLLERLEKVTEGASDILEGYQALERSKKNLELRLSEERCSLLTVYKIAKTLGTYDRSEAEAGIVKLVRAAFNPSKFSLFRLEGQALSLQHSYGWHYDDRYSARFEAASELTRSIIRDKHTLSIATSEGEELLNNQGLIAGAIFDEKTGKVYGMLKLEAVEFMRFGIRTHETFGIVCAWIARTYANIEQFEEATDHESFLIREQMEELDLAIAQHQASNGKGY